MTSIESTANIVQRLPLFSSRIGLRPLARLCRRVGTSHQSGVDILRIWDTEAQHARGRLRNELQAVRERLAGGMSISEAMKRSRGYFPPLTVEMIDVGEQTGRLERALLQLADHYDHLLELRREFFSGIAWPVIQLVAGIMIVGGLIVILGFVGLPETHDPFGFGLGFGGAFWYFLSVGIVAGLFAFLVTAIRRGWFGFDRALHLIVHVPVIGTCFQTMALSRFCWTLAMGLDAGIDARRAVRMALRSTHSPFYRRHIEAVDRAVLAGQEFHEALRPTGAFNDDFLASLEAAELSGTGAESMERLASEYRDRAKAAMRILTVAASFAIWGIIAAILIFVIFTLFNAFILRTYRDAFEGLPENPYR